MTALPVVQAPADAHPQDVNELAGLAMLAAEGAGGMVARIRELHEAIAARSFGPTSRVSSVSRVNHDVIAGGIYAGLHAGTRLAGAGLARAIAAMGGGPAVSAHPRGRLVQGALNGWIGDRLEASSNPLRVPMAVRVRHRDVPVDGDALAAAFPQATARPVVFVHGLGESDAAWRIRAVEHGGTYLSRVLPDVGGTGVLLRYNSGLRVSENGRRLSALLEALVDAWPVDVEALALVGHSMGGLVIRSAGHAAGESGHGWPQRTRTTIYLGTPHLGAPLEHAAGMATAVLGRVPEARPVAAVLASRSAGIKDLRHGTLVDAEWVDRHPDAYGGYQRIDVPLLEGAAHHVVAATLTEDPRHPLARVLGDLLVLSASAHGREGRRRVIPFEQDSCRHVGRHDHFDLLNSPRVDPLLREWLTPEA
jgi:pimeloyl-ACP methyl ester carboxylesterase